MPQNEVATCPAPILIFVVLTRSAGPNRVEDYRNTVLPYHFTLFFIQACFAVLCRFHEKLALETFPRASYPDTPRGIVANMQT